MKSDREFLNGIYEKSKTLTSDTVVDLEAKLKQSLKPTIIHPAFSIRYLKYSGMAASFLLLLTIALFLKNTNIKNGSTDNRPVPSAIRMVNYSEQLAEQASDIIAVEASEINGEIVVNIIKSYKTSGIDLKNLTIIDNSLIGLANGQSAIIFIKADSENASIMDIFMWNQTNSNYENQYEETIDLETLINLTNERKKDK